MLIYKFLRLNLRIFHFLMFIFRVLIFAEKKADVDNIYEYLLLKGVDVASIHGGKGILLLFA